MFKKIPVLGIVFFFVLTGSLFAQTIIKDDFRVNDDFDIGGSDQRMPAIAMDHQGNFVVVWVDERSTGLDIYGQRFDRWGNPLGRNFRVNETRRYSGYNLGVSMDGKGDFVVVWEDNRNNNTDIFAQRYDSQGSPIGSNFRVNDDPGRAFQGEPSVAMNPSGEIIVIWKDYRESSPYIYGQRYSSTGNPNGGNFKIVSLESIRFEGPGSSQIAVAINPKGEFVVTWTASLSQTRREIHAIRVSAKNEILGSEFKVNDSDSTAFPSYPDVAMDAPGNFVITWQEKRPEAQDIYAQRYSFEGEALGSNLRVNEVRGQFFKGLPASPKVTMALSKQFIVAWLDFRESKIGIYLQYFNQFGELEGGNVKVANIGYYPTNNLDIAKTPSGHFALIWDGYVCSNDFDIFAMIFNQQGEIVRGWFKVESDSGSSNQWIPAIAASPSGKFIISWNDIRLCHEDIFAQRFNSFGEFLDNNFKVNQETPQTKFGIHSSVSMDSLGNSIIAFSSYYGIYLQRYGVHGDRLGENKLVNDDSSTYGLSEPDVAMNQKGSFAVVWTKSIYTYEPFTLTQFIITQFFDSQGNKVGSNLRVDSLPDETLISGHPEVAECQNGNIVVVWHSSQQISNKSEIWGQLYDAAGLRIDGNFKISDTTVNRWNYYPTVGTDLHGNFIVGWSVPENILIQRFKADGSKEGPIIKAFDFAARAPKFSEFSLAVRPTGEFLVTWMDFRNGNSDIYAQRFDSKGNPLGGNFRVNSDQGDNTQMSPGVAADDKNYYFAWVDNRNLGSGFDIFAKIISFEPTFVSEPGASAKPEFSLLQNYPNPFNPTTTIPFTVNSSKSVVHSLIRTTLKIYNILGQKVRTLVDEDKLPGSYQVTWDGKDEGGKEVSSGVYFYVIKVQDLIQTRKMTLLK